MFRILSSLITLAAIAAGAWWLWNNSAGARSMTENFIQEHLETGNFLTLETRYSAESIMEAHRQELLKDESYSFLQPSLHFFPYLLMDVKYTNSHNQTGEGKLLWGETDGEMVIDTASWEKTHGFEDCINADATRADFKVINALAKRKGAMSREELLENLYVEEGTLDQWLENCRKKHLIVQKGHSYRLHFQGPHLNVAPETRFTQWPVTQPYKGSNRMDRRYSEKQIREIAQAAFGHDFAVRKVTEVFLPVYAIKVKNPDGSVLTSYWNALNGKRVAGLAL
ncbi:MAG: hypothetical protein KJ675_16745 [Gammaproteobacteria bacterium]|nr:hypothetical protein [Gammaproteobacteria bacterium]